MDDFLVEAAARRRPLPVIATDPAVLAELVEFTARHGAELAIFAAETDV